MHSFRPVQQPPRRATIVVGVALSVLLHAIGLWFLLYAPHLIFKPPPISSSPEPIVVTLSPAPRSAPVAPPPPAPPSAVPPSANEAVPQAPAKEAAKKPLPRPPRPKPPIRKPPLAKNTPPADNAERKPDGKLAPPAPPADVARREMSVPDDMFTQIEAARKRRAQALAAEGAPPADSPAPNDNASRPDNSVALANIAESLNRAKGSSRERDGGVFQIRRLGMRDAEFMFRGWSLNTRRDSSRLVTVDQGAEIDIQTAVVKRMIEIIREQQHEDFIWVSDRLGREVTLSARLRDSVELQRFLLREFFPDYARLGQR